MHLRLLLFSVLILCLIFEAALSFSGGQGSKNNNNNENDNNLRIARQAYTKKSKCLNPPRTARRVENFINECQDEVKNKLIREAFEILREEASKSQQQTYAVDDGIQFMETGEYHLHHVDINGANEQPAIQLNGPHPEQHYEYLTYTTTNTNTNTHNVANERVSRLLHGIRHVADIPTNGIYHPTLVPFEDKRIAGCLLHCVYAKNNAIDKFGWPTLDGLVEFYSEGVNEHGFFMATLRSVNLCLRAVSNKYHINRRKLPERGESCDLAFDVFDCISDQITGYCLDNYR